MAKNLEFKARVLRCETSRDSIVWNTHQITTMSLYLLQIKQFNKKYSFFRSILSILSMAIITSTIISLLLDYFSIQNYYLNSSIVRSLSLINSWKDIFGQNSNKKPIQLYGVRTVVLIWIIIVHTVVVVDFQYFRMFFE